MVYGDICGGWTAPLVAPFAWDFRFAVEAGFFVREAAVRLTERLTGAEATEAGIFDVIEDILKVSDD